MTDQNPDLSALVSRLGQMREQLEQAQASARQEVVEGRAGGGAVTIRATGDLEFQSIHIDRSIVDPDRLDELEDLVLAAVRDTVERTQELHRQALGGFGDGFEGFLGQ